MPKTDHLAIQVGEPHSLLADPILRDAAEKHVQFQEALGLVVLPGWEAFRLSDEQGLPLDVIRMQCREKKIVVDEWGLRLCMYLSGQDVPAPVLWQVPLRAEDVDDPGRLARAEEAWKGFGR